MEEPTVEAVQRITGCGVIGYHSQIVFNPERVFEIFVLDRPADSSAEPTPSGQATNQAARASLPF